MKPKLAIVIGFLIAAGVIIFMAAGGKKKNESSNGAQTAAGSAGSGSASTGGAAAAKPSAEVVELTFEHSTEKKDWLEAAIAELGRTDPSIKVKLVGKGSLDSVNDILEGKSQPVLWSPADSHLANLLASDWQTKHGKPLFPTTGDAAPQPLLLTPLVFAVWEDRAKVLRDAANGQLTWKAIHKAVTAKTGWPAVGGKPAWGFVKLGHTDPTRSNSGLQALVLMALEYFGTQAVTVEHVLDPKFQEFVKQIETGVTRLDASTGTFMVDMLRFGPSKYDIALVYESLAISQLENASQRWDNLHIYYPSVTVWSDHPVAILDAPWVTPAQRAAAEKVIAYLRSKPVQATALRFGFRPADPAVPIKTADGSNPFTKTARYGLSFELPPAVQPAEGPVVRNLLMMWSRVVKR
jgi:ABC-type Fe3+ transport system substrate-binding protein